MKINDDVVLKGKVLEVDSDGDVFIEIEGLGDYWLSKDNVSKQIKHPAEDKQIKGAENK